MKKFFYLFSFFCLSNATIAQHIPKDPYSENSNFSILSGKLDNGLSYIIKPIDGNTGKIEAGLVVNAGANQEEADQYQFAHLLEHLAANYTVNFPSLRSNVELFSQLKLSPHDYSAFVGGDYTTYKFKYLQEVPQALDTALSIFHDITSGKVLLEESLVQTEKKTLYQEYLFSGTAKSYPEFKIQNQLTGCRDSIPTPNNFENILMSSSLESLRQFYFDWYRPDLITIYVIGNIENVELVQKKIEEKFEDIKRPAQPRQKKNCLQNYKNRPNHFIVEERNPEQGEDFPTRTTFQFYYRSVKNSFPQFSKDEHQLFWNVLVKMIDNRLNTQQQTYNQNYSTHFYESTELPARILEIRTFNDQRPLIKSYEILAGISEYGFIEEELEKVVNQKIKDLMAQDYSTVSFWSNAIKSSLNSEKAQPLSKNFNEIGFLKDLDVVQLNSMIKSHINWMPDDIAIIKPQDFPGAIFSEQQIKKLIKKGLKQPAGYHYQVIPEQLLSAREISELPKAQIVKETTEVFDEHLIQLENGVKIILKQNNPATGRYKDKIMVHGFSPKGASCFGAKDYNAIFAPLIIQNSGVGKYDKFILKKILATTSFPFGIHNYIDLRETGVKAEVLPQDLGILMQLIYLSFSQPRYDPNAFEDWKTEEQKISHRNSNANNNFIDFINDKVGVVKLPQGINRLEKSRNVDYEEAFKKYKLLHSNAEEFTFIITGNFKKSEVLPILQRYLGNLPNEANKFCKEKKKDELLQIENAHFSLPPGVENNFLAINFTTPLKNDPGFKEEIEMEFLKLAIILKLQELRYEKNLGVYFSTASASIDNYKKTMNIQIYLQSNREDFDKVLEACNGFIEELRTNLKSNKFLGTVKGFSYFPKWQENNSDSNKMVMHSLYYFYRFNLPIIDKKEAQEFIAEFTAEDLLKAANFYFKQDNQSTYIGSQEVK